MALYFEDRWWQEYLEDVMYRDGPHLRKKGLPVWVLVGNFQLYKGDKKKALGGYSEWLTYDDLEAALAYYAEFPEVIDRRLRSMEQD